MLGVGDVVRDVLGVDVGDCDGSGRGTIAIPMRGVPAVTSVVADAAPDTILRTAVVVATVLAPMKYSTNDEPSV